MNTNKPDDEPLWTVIVSLKNYGTTPPTTSQVSEMFRHGVNGGTTHHASTGELHLKIQLRAPTMQDASVEALTIARRAVSDQADSAVIMSIGNYGNSFREAFPWIKHLDKRTLSEFERNLSRAAESSDVNIILQVIAKYHNDAAFAAITKGVRVE